MNTTKYMQTDSRWSQLPFRNLPDNIGNNGCGECSIVNMIIEMERYKNYTPATIQPYCRQWASSKGYLWSGVPETMKHYGLTEIKECPTMEPLWKELSKGDRVAFLIMNQTPAGSKKIKWTTGGHCIAVTGYKYENGLHKVYVKDSYSKSKDRNGWISYEENLRHAVIKIWVGKLNGKLTDGTIVSEVKGTAKPEVTVTTNQLKVDGIGGPATVKRMQQFFKTTQDGVISGQLKARAPYYPSLQAVSFGKGGSSCIVALQKWLGLSNPDGIIGKNTTRAWQKKLVDLNYFPKNEVIDGIFGVRSMKAWQECLNNNGKKKGSTPDPKPTPSKTDLKIIDVSEFQDAINWTKAKADGVKGAIIRCGYRGYESGTLKTDSMFLNHIKGAYKAGIPVGIYMFTEAKTEKEGREEADYAIKLWQTAGVPISFPIAVDTEASGGNKDRCKNLTRAQRTNAIKGFCERIKERGYTPMIYASTSWLNSKLDMSKLPYDVWCAQYYSKCEYKGKYIMWQYTSEGRVNGIKGNVDLNHCYIQPKEVQPPKEVKPAPKPTQNGNTYQGSYPTDAEIKSASNAGVRDKICSWAKKIADSGEYHYKRWNSKDIKTQECPICKHLTGKYKGWNCIGFAWASWHHGGNLPSECDCGVISNDTADKILKAKTDAEATKIAQKYVGIKDLKVIRNDGKTIPATSLWRGDVVLYFKSTSYFHTVLYAGDGKISESNTTNPNISYGKKLSTSYDKVAIRYTGGKNYVYKGDRGDAITKIQNYLNWYTDGKFFKECGGADGKYGDNTLKYVIKMQTDFFGTKEADGTVGYKTIEAMKKVKK